MPYTWTIDPDSGLIEVTATGASNVPDTLSAMRQLHKDPAFRPESPMLVDGRKLDYVATFADALAFRDAFEGMRDKLRGPIAFVVENPVQYGTVRMLGSMTDLVGIKIQAFHDLDSARRWLEQGDGGQE